MSWAPKSPAPPAGYSYGPRYRPSPSNIIRAITFICLGWPRSLARDGALALHNAPSPPLIRDGDHIPESGPFIIVANHYERPGLWMAWPAIFVAHAVWMRTGRDTHWVAIEEWESFSVWGIPIPRAIVRAVFDRAFHTYRILAMPAPDSPAATRAAAMRRVASDVQAGCIVGIMPEGTVGPTPELLEARQGAGAFILLLASHAPVLPVAIYEEDNRLVVRFGEAFHLTAPHELPRDGRDAWARRVIMERIRDLLPHPLWGAFARNA